MNYFKSISCRWDEKELAGWSSMRKTAYLLLPILFYFAVHDLFQILLWGLLELFITNAGEEAYTFLLTHSGTVQGIVGGASILAGTAAISSAVKRELAADPGMKAAGKSRFLLAACLILLALSGAFGMNFLLDGIGLTGSSEAFEQVRNTQYGVQFGVGLVLYGVLSPMAEEAVFRGLLYNRMKRCFGLGIGLVASSLLFGLYHGNLVQGVYGFFLGLLIACAYELCQSFAAPMLIHGVANAGIYTITYGTGGAAFEKKTEILLGILLLAGSAGLLWFIAFLVRKQRK